jgi:sugar phosphate isomerase/epimerase
VKLGVYSISVPEWPPEQVIEAVKAHGYEGVEWVMGYPDARYAEGREWHIDTRTVEQDVDRVGALCREAGLSIPSVGTRVSLTDEANARKQLEATARLGAPMARMSAFGFTDEDHYPDLIRRAAARYREVEGWAREAGVRALVELHHGTIWPSASAAIRIIGDRDPAHVGVLLDPGNMVLEGRESWRFAAELLGPFLAHVHVKSPVFVRDAKGCWRPQWVGLEEGLVDWAEVIAALGSVGYAGYLCLEDFQSKEPGVKLREARAFLAPLVANER